MRFFRKVKGFTLVEIMIVVAIIGILIAIAVPGFIRARCMSRMKSCQENLTKIDGAKEQWALENNKTKGDTVAASDIVRPAKDGYLKAEPIEPTGATGGDFGGPNLGYSIELVGDDPLCQGAGTNPGHSIADVGAGVTDCP